MVSNREVLYFLQTIPGIGNKTIGELWKQFGNGKAIWTAEEKELKKWLKSSQVRAFLREREKEDPGSRLAKLERKGIRYCSIFDSGYPKRLLAVADRPWALFVRGQLPDEEMMSAAVIGARNHSYYGEKQTRIFTGLIAREGIGIVSGMARGIDSIAQETAIREGGLTYAVLGCGVDICYPEENRWLFETIPGHGGIISEYLPGTMPRAGLFPRRNRIISALGDILLVMEAREKSGTLITVDMALEQGKEIWALPGRCDDVLSHGCNRLIAQGAGILTGVSEFGKELDFLKNKYGRKRPEEQKNRLHKAGTTDQRNEQEDTVCRSAGGEKDVLGRCSEKEKAVYSVMGYDPMSLNMIFDKMSGVDSKKMTVAQISVILTGLCIKGLCRQVNGSWYVRL